MRCLPIALDQEDSDKASHFFDSDLHLSETGFTGLTDRHHPVTNPTTPFCFPSC